MGMGDRARTHDRRADRHTAIYRPRVVAAPRPVRDKVLFVRVSQDEHEAVRQAAGRIGAAEWARRQLTAAAAAEGKVR